jgi:hypothetical protein
MAGLIPAIHVFVRLSEGVDARDKRGRDGSSCADIAVHK